MKGWYVYRVMNGPIVAIARELGFEGNSFLEGLVVSIFIAGAFIGSICSASFVDSFGCRRTLQLDTIPLILGALLRFILSVLYWYYHGLQVKILYASWRISIIFHIVYVPVLFWSLFISLRNIISAYAMKWWMEQLICCSIHHLNASADIIFCINTFINLMCGTDFWFTSL